jgi:hypothetical protein
MKRFFVFVFVLTVLQCAAQEVVIVGEVVPKTEREGLRTAIQLLFRVGGKNEDILLPTEGAPFDAASYSLTTERGDEIAVTPVVDKEAIADPTNTIGSVTMYSGVELDPKLKYFLTVKPGVLVFRVPGVANKIKNARTTLEITGDDIAPAQNYAEQRQARTSKLELGAGTPGGVASIELVMDQSKFLNVDWMNLRLQANAEVALSRDGRDEFFNSLSGQAMFYRPLRFANNYSEVALTGKVESDQTFDIVDSGAGVRWAWFAKNKATDALGHIFIPEAVSVPPLVILSYDYLKSVKSEPGVADDDHHHRLTGILRYRLPIAEKLDLSALPALGGAFDLFVDFELKGMYDSGTDDLHDQSWVSLVFQRSTGPERFKPALSFTWARGKAPPTFEQVSALFAGFSLAF